MVASEATKKEEPNRYFTGLFLWKKTAHPVGPAACSYPQCIRYFPLGWWKTGVVLCLCN